MRQGKRAGRRTVEEFPARLLRTVIVVRFPLTPRVGKTGPEGKEDLFAVGVLQFEIGLQRVVVCESLGLRIRKVVVSPGHEGRTGGFAPVVHETVVELGGSRGFQAFEPGGIVIHASLLLRREAGAHRSGSALFRKEDHDATAADRRVSGIAHEGQLVFFRITRHQDAAGVEEAAVVNHFGRPVSGQRAAQPRFRVAEPAFLELLLELQVHHLLAVFGHAGEFLGIGLLVDDLHLVHHLGGQILQSHFRVIGEEGLTAHRNARDRFAIILDGAVVRHFHAGHALEQVFQDGILPELERGCIEDHGILLDLDRIADRRDARGIEQLRIFRQGDRTQVDFPLAPGKAEILLRLVALVAQQLHEDVVGAERDLLDLGHTQRIGHREVRNQRIVLGRQINRRVRDGRLRLLLDHLEFHRAHVGTVEAAAARHDNHLCRRRLPGRQRDYQREGRQARKSYVLPIHIF